MSKVISIDPGTSKCGLVVADSREKKVYEAIVINSKLILNFIKKQSQKEKNIQFIIGNGTSCKNYIKDLKKLSSNVIIAEEKNSTYRAKQRYFEIFPILGIKYFLPREIFILNKNLDALSALIIMEDYFKVKFDFCKQIKTKTWLK